MSIDNPTSALDNALGAEERANERVCALEDQLTGVLDALEKINAAACYASEEATESRADALLLIGEIAREAMTKVTGIAP